MVVMINRSRNFQKQAIVGNASYQSRNGMTSGALHRTRDTSSKRIGPAPTSSAPDQPPISRPAFGYPGKLLSSRVMRGMCFGRKT